MDTQRYINEVLPIALESGNRMSGTDWTYQQDGARPHIHRLSQKKWCTDHFPSFISKDQWPPKSSNLCPLDYSLWNELEDNNKGSIDKRNKTFCQRKIEKRKYFKFCT